METPSPWARWPPKLELHLRAQGNPRPSRGDSQRARGCHQLIKCPQAQRIRFCADKTF